MKKLSLILGLVVGLAAAGWAWWALGPGVSDAPDVLHIGVTAGPHEEILAFVDKRMRQDGFSAALRIHEFNDFILPNVALNEGTLHVNAYQHEPFLREQIDSRGYKNINILGNTILLPMGFYSKTYKKVEDLPAKARIAVPNDPTNEGRALRLLQSLGLVSLKQDAGIQATLLDIENNPKQFDFVELEAPQVPRILDDVDAACINTDWALVSGLQEQPIALESVDNNPYVNILAVHSVAREERREALERFLNYYYSKETKAFIENTYAGRVLTSW